MQSLFENLLVHQLLKKVHVLWIPVVQCHFHNSPPLVLIRNYMNPREMPGFHCSTVEVFALLRTSAALVGKPMLHKTHESISHSPTLVPEGSCYHYSSKSYSIPRNLSNFEALCNILKPANFLEWAAVYCRSTLVDCARLLIQNILHRRML
jgi:hypothetical protein